MAALKKMALVDLDTLTSLKEFEASKSARIPIQEKALEMSDKNLKQILDSDISNEDKLRQYQQELSTNLAMGRSRPRPAPQSLPPPQSLPLQVPHQSIEQQIESIVPVAVRKKVPVLLSRLATSKMTWRPDGSIIYKNTPIDGANIMDLVNDALVDRKSTSPPIGHLTFKKVLKEVNAPKTLIGNQKRYGDPLPGLQANVAKRIRKAHGSTWNEY
jgi:hypothetical protein